MKMSVISTFSTIIQSQLEYILYSLNGIESDVHKPLHVFNSILVP